MVAGLKGAGRAVTSRAARQQAVRAHDQQAQAEKDRELLNAGGQNYVMTETAIVDGQEVTTTRTVTFDTPSGEGTGRAQQLANQMRQYASGQVDTQGAMVYGYITAATQTLKSPQPAIELNVVRDPLVEAAVTRQD